jgi:hypothetical protein
MTNNYFAMLLEIPNSIASFEGSQVLPLCFSDNIIKMNISMEHWWNGAEYLERTVWEHWWNGAEYLEQYGTLVEWY